MPIKETVSVKWDGEDVTVGLNRQKKAHADTGAAAEAAAKKAAAAAKQQAAEVARGEAEFRRLAASLSPVIKAEQQLASAQRILDTALKSGRISQEQYNRLLAEATARNQRAAAAASHTAKATADQSRATAQAQDQFRRLASSLDPAIRAQERMASAQRILDAALRAGKINQEQYNRMLAQARQQYSANAQGALRLSDAVRALAGAYAVRQLVAYAGATFEASQVINRTSRSLQAVTGSASQARVEIDFLRQVSERLGTSFEAGVSGYGRFVAAATQGGIALEDIRNIYTGVATAASALGLSQSAVEFSFVAMQQMASKGVVSLEELRRQLGDHIPGAVGIMARALGVSTGELLKMIEAGEVGAKEALPKFAAELERTFEAMAKLGAVSPAANVQRFKNALFELSVIAGEELAPALGKVALDLARLAKDDDTRQMFRELGEQMADAARIGGAAMAFLIENAELLKAAMIAIIAIKMTDWMLKAEASMIASAGASRTMAGSVTALGGSVKTLTSILAALPAALLLVNEGISAWKRSLEDAIDEATDLSRKELSLDLRIDLAIDSGEAGELDDLQQHVQETAAAARDRLDEESRKIEELGDAIREAKRKIAAEGTTVESVRFSRTGTMTMELTEAAAELENLEAALEAAIKKEGEASAEAKKYEERLKRLSAAVRHFKEEEEGAANDKLREKFEKLLHSLDSVAKATDEYKESVKTLDEALAAGMISQAEHDRLIALAHKEMTDAMRDKKAAAEEEKRLKKELAEQSKRLKKEYQEELKQLKALADAQYELSKAQRQLAATQSGTTRDLDRRLAAEEAIRDALESSNAVIVRGVPVLNERGRAMVTLAVATHDAVAAIKLEKDAQEAALDVMKRSSEAARDRAKAEGELRAMIEGGRAALEQYRRTMEAWTSATGSSSFVGPLTVDQERIFRDSLAAGSAERDLDELLDQDKWEQWGRTAAGALQDVDAGLADVASSLGAAAGAWKDYAQAVAEGNEAAAQAARQRMGAAVAGVIGSVASSQGWTGGGTSSFGGQRSGNMMAQGAQVGGMFGGWGAVIGAVVGAFVNTGADDARVALEESMSGIRAVVREAEGGLVDMANEMARVLGQFFNSLETALGQDLETAGLEIHVRDDLITVTVGGATQGFRSLSEALAWAVEMTLGQQDFEGLRLDPNMSRVLGSMGGQNPGTQGSFEQLQAAFNLAQQLDDMVAGVGSFGSMMREIAVARENETDLMRRYNLVARDVLALTDLRIAQAREEVLAARDAMLGVSNRTAAAQQVEQMMRAFNSGLDDETAARQRQADELRIAIAQREAETGATAGAVLAGDDLRSALGGLAGDLADVERGGRGAAGAAREGSEAFNDSRRERGEEAAAAIRATRTLEQMREELAAVEASLEGIPSAIPVDEIANVWTAAGAAQFQELLDLVRRVRGEQFGAAEEQRIQGQLYAAQLATSYAALLQLQEASGGLFTVSSAFLTEVEATLQDVLSGAALPTAPGGGGQGDARRRAAEDFRRSAADIRAALDGATDSQLSYARAVRELREQATEARIPAQELAAAIADLAAIELRDIAAPWEEAAAAFGEADIATAMRQLRERYEDALADALVRAGDNPAAYEMAAQAITAGFAAEVAALAQGSLIDLGDRALALQLQTRETATAIQFLLDNLAELGLTAEDVANAVTQGALPALLDIAAAAAEAAGDEQALARIREQQRQLEQQWMRLQLEALVAQLTLAGAITAEIQAIIDDTRRLLSGGGPRLETEDGKPGADPAAGVAALRERFAALEEALAAVAARGISPALQGLQEWRAEMARLQAEIDATASSEEDRARRSAALRVENERQELAAVQGLMGEIQALGVVLPVEVTQALARAEFELARARVLAALADAEMVAALEAYGIDVADLAGRVSDAVFGLDQALQRPPSGWWWDGLGREPGTHGEDPADDLASIREEMAAWLQDLSRSGLHPTMRALLELDDRLEGLRERLLAAGGTASELADLEAAVAEERRRIISELDDDLRDVLAELRGTGDPSLSPAARLQRAQSQFDELLAAAQGGDLAAREGLGGALRELVEAMGATTDTSSLEYQQQLAALLALVESVLAGFDATAAQNFGASFGFGPGGNLPGPDDFGNFLLLQGGQSTPSPINVTSTLNLPDLVHTMGRHDAAILATLRSMDGRLASLESIAFTDSQRVGSMRAAGPRPV